MRSVANRIQGLCCVGLLLFVGLRSVCGAVPSVDQLFPVFVTPGTTNDVVVVGKVDPWPGQLWVDHPGIRCEPTTNSGIFRVIVAEDVSDGPVLTRVFNSDGASGTRFIVVTSQALQSEKEPNDLFTKPQVIDALPVSIQGRLEKADVDSFAVTLEEGQTLVAQLDAQMLQSPIDAVLRVLDGRGVQRAWNHDNGRTLDPAVAFTVRSAGSYVVQVFGFDHPANSDVKFGGNAKCVYRLRLSKGPMIRYPLPLGVPRGSTVVQQLFGWGERTFSGQKTEVGGPSVSNAVASVEMRWPGVENSLTIPVGDGQELVEQESGGDVRDLEMVPVPGAVSGRIQEAGDEDRFRFTARKDAKLIFEVLSAEFGFPLDAWLRIEDAQRKELARSDDGNSSDPRLEWTPPADGDFFVVIGSLLRRGGTDYVYRLAINRPRPSFNLTLATEVFTIEPGKTNDVKVAVVRRDGFQGKFRLVIEGLPTGLRSEPMDIPEKDGDVTLKLIADSQASATNTLFQVRAEEVGGPSTYPAMFLLASTGENNGVPQGYRHLVIESHSKPWLTVLPPKKESDKKEPEKK